MLVRDLGVKEYEEAWTLQRRLVFERAADAAPDTVLLCQHPPVYTIGRSSRQPVPEGLPYPVHKIERGGDLTWHGPGQLVGYPILRLSELGLKPRSYLAALEAVLAEAVRPFGVEAGSVKGFTGLWAGRKKLASIGVAVKGGISYHGFALNMNCSLAAFRMIHPCKLEGDSMTTMAQLVGEPVDEHAVTKAVGEAMLRYFGGLMKTAALLALALAAPAAAAPAKPAAGPFELVYSYPAETSLEEKDLRQAAKVWPEMIGRARKSVDVAQFYVARSTGEALDPTLEAIRKAAKRGVKVRVLLEKKFEKNSLDGIAYLKASPGVELRIIEWSKVAGKGIVHAKYFVVDGAEAFVGSQNFDWRALAHIHEMGLRISEPGIAAKVQAVFDADWAAAEALEAGLTAPELRSSPGEPAPDATAYLVASPWRYNPDGVTDSESELVRRIAAAKEELAVQLLDYKPTSFGFPPRFYAPIDNALRDAALRGVKIKLMVSHWNTEESALAHLKSLSHLPGVEIKIVTIPEAKSGFIPFARVIHSKYMVVDGATLWLGTSNWAGGYLDESRNLELVVKDPSLAARARAVHERLWTSPYADPLDLSKAYPKPRKG